MESNNPFSVALRLILSGDASLTDIVSLSLQVSAASVVISLLIGLPFGALLATKRFWGRGALIILFNALLGLPPVVVGLSIYLLLSRTGPFGFLDILYTPLAMMIAQVVLILPIAIALSRQLLESLHQEYAYFLSSLGLSSWRRMVVLLQDAKAGLVTIALACAGRALSEVGAIIIVGGNINHVTRMMTTAIALETSRGELALAMALGIILLTISLVINIASQLVKSYFERDNQHV